MLMVNENQHNEPHISMHEGEEGEKEEEKPGGSEEGDGERTLTYRDFLC